jgi:hypothetical protein
VPEQSEQQVGKEARVALHFLGGDTGTEGSPRLWEEGPDLLVQGYTVEDPAVLDELRLPPGETVVRVPKGLMKYLPPRVLKELTDGAAGS